MFDLDFQVEGVQPIAHAAAPTLAFKLRLSQVLQEGAEPSPVHSVALRCQLRIEPARRRYSEREQDKLLDLFGEPARWGQTMHSMLWTHASTVVPSFAGGTLIDLPVSCTYDFNLGATKYFDALADGLVPVSLLFSGTIFYAGEDGALQVAQVPWEKEANYRLPVEVWRRMMDLYYPNAAWLCLRKDVFDRLAAYKAGRMLPTWEQALEGLFDEARQMLAPGNAGVPAGSSAWPGTPTSSSAAAPG